MTLNRIGRLAAGMALLLLAASPTFAQDYDLRGVQVFAPADISPYGSGPQVHEGYFFSFEELYWATSKPNVVLVGAEGSRNVATSGTQVPISLLWPPPGSPPDTPLPTNPLYWAGLQTYDERSTIDTNQFESRFIGGERVEFGRVVDGFGWGISITRLRDNNQSFTAAGADVLFDDPQHLLVGPIVMKTPGQTTPVVNYYYIQYVDPLTGDTYTNGDLADTRYDYFAYPRYNFPVTFDRIDVNDQTKMWGIEGTLIRRTKQLHHGGYLEFSFGARYLEFEDNFEVYGTGGAFNVSDWRSAVENHIAGPQVGLHYFKQAGRFVFSVEGRFMAGFNRTNVNQTGFLGSFIVPNATVIVQNVNNTTADIQLYDPSAWQGVSFNNHDTFNEFSPVVELRLDAKYQLTKSFTLRAGWTGLWVDNVRRGSNMILYQAPTMGVDPSRDKLQNVFFNGLSMGVDINR